MAGITNVYNNEQYMADAVTSVLTNRIRAAKKRSNYIWSAQTFNLQGCLSPTYSDNENHNNNLKEVNKKKELLDEDKQVKSKVAPHQICHEISYLPEFRSSTKQQNSVYSTRSTFLSTMGLKMLSSGIPKKSVPNQTRRDVKVKSHKVVNYQRANLVVGGESTRDQFCQNSHENSELKYENYDIADVQMHSSKDVDETVTLAETPKSEDKDKKIVNKIKNRFVPFQFQEWCHKRKTDYEHYSPEKTELSPSVYLPISPPVYPPIDPPVYPPINPPVYPPFHSPICPPIAPPVYPSHSVSTSMISADAETLITSELHFTKLKKRVRHDSSNSYKCKEKTNVKKRLSEKKCNADMFNDSTEAVYLCIAVIVEGKKCHEVMTELQDFLRLKKSFPQFGAAVPGVDCEEKELNYSAEAVKTALGFLFSPSYNVNSIQNETTAVEILALIHIWGIVKFQRIIQNHCLQNILKEGNVKKIYSLADHFNLDEIKEACLKLSKDVTPMKFKERKCSIAVSTFVDPLEFCIPLHPAKESLAESFDRSIVNEIVFKSLSGNYIITGIQIQLNIDSSISSSSKIKIFYSAENVTENIEIPEEKIEKKLASKIIIHFNKNLVIKPHQKGKISIYSDIKPCLCYTFEKEMIKEKNPDGEFSLTLNSNHTVPKSDKKKSFLIGKLFYHLRKNPI